MSNSKTDYGKEQKTCDSSKSLSQKIPHKKHGPAKEYWYRYDYITIDRPSYDIKVKIYLDKLPVLKHTAKGVWIGYSDYDKRFVLANARKRYACPTTAEAAESFIARKTRQKAILTAQLRNVTIALDTFLSDAPTIQNFSDATNPKGGMICP